MAFPTTSVLDTFTDGSAPQGLQVYSANWATGTLFPNTWITNADGTAHSQGADTGNGWTTTYGPDVEVYCTITAKGADGTYLALYARCSDFGSTTIDGYEAEIDFASGTDTVKVSKITDGSFAFLTGGNPVATQEFSVGDAFGFEIIGNSLKVYRKPSGGSWGQIGSTLTDSTYTGSGRIGLQGSGNIDDFGGGTVVSGGITKAGAGIMGA